MLTLLHHSDLTEDILTIHSTLDHVSILPKNIKLLETHPSRFCPIYKIVHILVTKSKQQADSNPTETSEKREGPKRPDKAYPSLIIICTQSSRLQYKVTSAHHSWITLQMFFTPVGNTVCVCINHIQGK